YDLENRLVRAEIKKPAGNTEIWEYAYDPFGRRLSKERQDKLAWTSTDPKRTHFVWDGTRLLQEYTYKGSYTYLYTDQDSYEPLAQVFHNNRDEAQYLAYFHNDQIGIPREMTDIRGNLLWYGEYTAWGRLKKDGRVYQHAHQPFRLQNQYYDRETGLHYNYFRYYEPETGRFISQDPIGLLGEDNLYWFGPNTAIWVDLFGLLKSAKVHAKQYARQISKTEPVSKHPTTVAVVIDKKTGRIFYGESGKLNDVVHPELKKALPKTSMEKWSTTNCAEVNALNKALKARPSAKMGDFEVAAANVRTGKRRKPCKNCSVTVRKCH
ncbi:RHS repeat-associated core domain-containing protein, partial [Neisseria flavescens]|uniref:RHS repeat-associated core domain-containing protein n=1 Tax=Neisseria flavescens TaxID=484 RepID=UPI003C758C5E